MILKDNYDEFIKSNGQIALLPSVNTEITQGPGIVKDNTIDFNYHGTEAKPYAESHQKYRALDVHSDEKKLYAPFDCECVFFEKKGSAYIAIFESTRSVICPDGYVGKVHFLLVHGGSNIPVEGGGTLGVNDTFSQGDLIYCEGTDGGVPEHAHINAAKGTFTSFDYNTHLEEQKGYINVNGKLVWYQYNVYVLNNDSNIEDIFYIMPEESVTFDSVAKPVWENYISFTTYSGKLEWNGWIADGSEWYYYENGVKASGWLTTSDGSFYLDPNNGNAMLTGWFKENGSNYYFNPKDGEAGHKDNYVGGVMLTGWQWLDNHWYFFGESGVMQTGWVWSSAWQGWYYLYTSGPEAGQMAVSTWIDKVYYVGSDGKMYKDGIFTVDGVKYSFDNSGVATRL